MTDGTTNRFSHAHLPPQYTCGCHKRANGTTTSPPPPPQKKSRNLHRSSRFKPSLATIFEEPPNYGNHSLDATPSNVVVSSLSQTSFRPLQSPANNSSKPHDSSHAEVRVHEVEEVKNIIIEEIGEARILHLLCPCGTRFQFLYLDGYLYSKLA